MERCFAWKEEAWDAMEGARDLLLEAYNAWLKGPQTSIPVPQLRAFLATLPPVEGMRKVEARRAFVRLSFLEGVPMPFAIKMGRDPQQAWIYLTTPFSGDQYHLQSLYDWGWRSFARRFLSGVRWRPKEVYRMVRTLEDVAHWLREAAQRLEEEK